MTKTKEREAVEPVAWAPTSFRGEGYVYRRKEDAETLTGPATPLYDSRALKTTPAPAETGRERLAKQIGVAMANRADLPDPLIDPAVSTDEIAAVFSENLPDQAVRLGVHHNGTESPGQWRDRVRKAAILSRLRGEPKAN